MKKIFCLFSLAITSFFIFSSDSFAQRKAVSGAEVTGTFRSYFTGKFKGTSNEILIQALGGGKLKIEMSLIYPKVVNGEMTANTGEASGEAEIVGDTAIFVPDYSKESDGGCKITLKFTKPGVLVVTQEEENGADCGFGFNVRADGTYKKISAKKPKFGTNQLR